ncbi:formate dehydrogenase subunit alpha [Microtetraspora sp. NBRC 13810]|uniref:formate dehydrogenase subunit alpha n=1 Tax=Microtetraspora sp. NBRC 13810 TaxID=3030990 RepID=UPI0024A04233|nr:formate dehydrogenase subunit alpha [Microtetraspora sp. NBRC 13810]GLW12929.1 formate dehydrogenase subunit alpha [Microtetraspora sp. NBRC 13810]
MSLIKEQDYGTPAKPGEATVAVEIDGKSVLVPEGTSVMRAAAEAGIEIPKLCATDNLDPFGSCRLCLVDIDGRKGSPASCTTPVAPGMKVRTQTPELAELRRGVMELYISDHPLDCLTCPTNGDCELQDMAGVVGLRDVRYGYAGENHLDLETDSSNPYFDFDSSKCIACSRCVRACGEVQGTFALTIEGRGFDSRVAAGAGGSFMESDCVSCGACVQACPTATLQERSVVELGMPNRSVLTTCAYCGVGCSFKAELRGDEVVRMVPYKDGGANEGHSCVKGRFAFGYASHPDRQLKPMMRERITDEWHEVEWEEAIGYVGRRMMEIQTRHGMGAIGGISSSRCTNEEVYVVQKMVRAAFGNNNVDTCARVCHSPTGYGLKQTYGTSAGTQDFKSVDKADVILVIGANPTDAHPVFGSRIKRRLRQGAKLIVADPRRIDLVRSPHIEAQHHLRVMPGSNVALINAMAHVVVTEGLVDREFVAERCEDFDQWEAFISGSEHSPEAVEEITGVPAAEVRAATRLYAGARNATIMYGLGVTEHSQGSTMVMGMANLAMATGNIGREGVGVNPLRGQNNVQGSCDMGSFPHELPGYRHVSDDAVRTAFETLWGRTLQSEPGLRIPNMFDAAIDGTFRALFVHGEDIVQSDPNTKHVTSALEAMDLVVVQDLFLNETSKYAHVFLPGTSFLEKDGTFTNAERRINRVRPVMAPKTGKHEWQIVCEIAQAMGYPMKYDDSAQIMDEIAITTPTFSGVSFAKLDEVGSVQWPCNDAAPEGTPIMHIEGFVRGKGKFVETLYVPTKERSTRKFPLILTTGRILSQYNVGAQTRRTGNSAWHPEDLLEMHPHDAEVRGIGDGDTVSLASRIGETSLRVKIDDRMPVGVVYTTFHHPVTGANVVTTEHSDWATNCPEYKVTAVQVALKQPVTAQSAQTRAVPAMAE